MVEQDHIAKLMSRLISEKASSLKKPFLYESLLSMLSHMNYVHIHSDTFAFSNVHLKIVKCLVNDFSFCFNAFKVQVAFFLNSESLYTC